jgi:hypothetical protein
MQRGVTEFNRDPHLISKWLSTRRCPPLEGLKVLQTPLLKGPHLHHLVNRCLIHFDGPASLAPVFHDAASMQAALCGGLQSR